MRWFHNNLEKVPFGVTVYSFIYRNSMRLIHRLGFHWFRRLNYIEDGLPQKWCQWCGERHIIHKAIKLPKNNELK